MKAEKASCNLVWSTSDAESMIIKMARVSAPKNENNIETGPRLLRYLIKHRHWSPFEMANMCVEIYTQRDISAQICRHRSFSFQEWSQRYAETSQAAVPQFRRQDSHNRQNSFDDLTDEMQYMLEDLTDKHFKSGHDLYKQMLEEGVAKETLFRGVTFQSECQQQAYVADARAMLGQQLQLCTSNIAEAAQDGSCEFLFAD